MKLEAMIKRRDALEAQLKKSQSYYQGNIRVPSSVEVGWAKKRARIACWNRRIAGALKASEYYKAWVEINKAAGIQI